MGVREGRTIGRMDNHDDRMLRWLWVTNAAGGPHGEDESLDHMWLCHSRNVCEAAAGCRRRSWGSNAVDAGLTYLGRGPGIGNCAE